MKKFRKIALPLAIFALGIGSAYAGTASEKTESAITQGYRFDALAPPGEQCMITEHECSTVVSGDVCTYVDSSSNEQNLFQQSCVNVLYKIP
ncbi:MULTISPECIES: DUF6520 family protein [Chryseobacterium]|uniref:DUF6520 family protein n=1 Tax=Chryseobacterium TaxID=59732 RepID=UPI00069248E1|nr:MULTISPECIES: DUF6520 family protein [Chryseobacterium]MCD0456323.1 DUF6520 family protein [Chryseobacterium sp. LC2016-27]